MQINRVGVVGCGTMGSGIVQVVARRGYSVTVSDISREALDRGLAGVDRWLRKSVDKGKISSKMKEDIVSRITGTTSMADLGDCDFVLEAALENQQLKEEIFTELDRVCPKHTVLASNASTIPIIHLAVATKRPDKVIGMHFFNPVPAMKLVEVVKSMATSDETVAAARDFAGSIGKTSVIAPDVPGYIHNRIVSVLGVAAIKMIEDGLATAKDIDTVLKLGSNMPLGRLELFDLIGLDTLLAGWENLYQEYRDPKYAPPLLLKRMVAAGWLGRKTGKGFYEYDKEGNKIE